MQQSRPTLDADDPFELTAQLVAVRSESFDETLLTDLLEERLASAGHLTLDRVGDNLVARTTLGRPHRVVLAGHTDTVPADGNEVPQLDGDTLWGLGAADMKGGLAVMVRLAELHAAPAVDVTYVFYAREEVAGHHSGLGELAAERPELLTGDVAVLGEPTNGDVEAGCQGTVRVRVVLRGARAHLARAWMGRNAIHRLGGLLTAVDSWTPRQPVLSGCSYHESLQVVAVKGGVAGNVVPDEVVLELGHRFAPDRTAGEAEEWVLGFLGPYLEDGDAVEVVDLSAGALPAVEHPFVAGMVRRHRLEVRAKLGWTDVARFAALGVPAVNLGPGDATLAHTAEERVGRDSVERSMRVLHEALGAGW